MDPSFLIISGTNRAGTTSVFNYLSDHPDIQGSFIKQTLFFIDKDLKGLTSKPIAHFDDGIEKFREFFKIDANSKFCLEASPDYMYSPGTRERLKIFASKNKVKIIFILRDPVDRFISWYYHAIKLGMIAKETSLESWLDIKNAPSNDKTLIRNTLESGKYSRFIQPYIKEFNQDQISVLFFEELVSSPIAFMENLCDQIQLDSSFYQNYLFEQFNSKSDTKSKNLMRGYRVVRSGILTLHNRLRLPDWLLSKARSIGSKLYRSVNTRDVASQPSMNQSYLEVLRDYYLSEHSNLENVIGRQVPWPRYHQSNSST